MRCSICGQPAESLNDRKECKPCETEMDVLTKDALHEMIGVSDWEIWLPWGRVPVRAKEGESA